MVFICYVTLQDQMIKVLNGFMVRGFSRYVNFGGHRYCDNGDIMV